MSTSFAVDLDNFDPDLMEAEIRRLAEVYPDATYASTKLPDGTSRCYYDRGEVLNGPPELGCIMGHAARNVLPQFYAQDLVDGSEEAAIGGMIGDIGEEVDFFLYVQENQDNGMTWSAAVQKADIVVAEDAGND